MLWNAGLSVGTSFAELTVRNAQTPETLQKRWYLPKLSLTDGLQSFFKEHAQIEAARLNVTVQSADVIVERRRGGPVAWLGTAGVEAWPVLASASSEQPPTLHLQRPAALMEPEFLFALSERTRADGTCEKPVPPEELEFLVAKLEMAHIQHVAVGLLHSIANPANERWVADELTKRGFLVNTSHVHAGCRDEVERWQATLLDAYVAHELVELQSRLKTLEETLPQIKEVRVISGYSPYLSQFELIRALSRNSPKETLLHLGLEQFVLIGGARNEEEGDFLSQAELPRFRRLQMQPTQIVSSGIWRTPSFSTKQSGYEPGPMIFGKSLVLTFLDVLALRHGPKAMKPVKDLLSDKAEKRITEALFTEAKTHYDSPQIEVQHIAESLEDLALDQMAQDILSFGAKSPVRCTGAFASLLVPALKKRVPHLRFVVGEDYAESKALTAEGI